ncbi:MAG TPA: hypothetical protein VIJ60_02045 [Acidimicrobiales bacterium]
MPAISYSQRRHLEHRCLAGGDVGASNIGARPSGCSTRHLHLQDRRPALARRRPGRQGGRRRVDARSGSLKLAEFAEPWLENRAGLYRQTREIYGDQLRLHILPVIDPRVPALGKVALAEGRAVSNRQRCRRS